MPGSANSRNYATTIASPRRRRLSAIGLSLAESARRDFATGLEGQVAAVEAKLHALLDRLPRTFEFTAGQAARMADMWGRFRDAGSR